MGGVAHRARTYAALGLGNLMRVFLYRLGVRVGLHPVVRLRGEPVCGPFFLPVAKAAPPAPPSARWQGAMHYFSAHDFPGSAPPDWHANPFRPGVRADADVPWYRLPDFDPAVGDIKCIWEASRWEWLIPMAQRAAAGEAAALDRLNGWLADWTQYNPPYRGANWKCGQEASIRVMHLATAAMVLSQDGAPSLALIALVRQHLRRIAPTIGYAIGQANNHGTSEAAALFIGGDWVGGADGTRWHQQGRKWLNDRAAVLIMPDGMFSQYSTVYHRLMIDSYALAEIWRRRRGLPALSAKALERLAVATRFLRDLMVGRDGDAPNMGANDGARLIPLSDSDYRDFRPAVQRAAVLFCDAGAIAGPGRWQDELAWLGLSPPSATIAPPTPRSGDAGGLHILRNDRAAVFLRYPRFRFRPAQADALHLDLWVDGDNLLRDGGSFSYNHADSDYFSGTASHNMIQFDGRDQMPRLSRFLFGAWLRARDVELVREADGAVTAAAGYRDWQGASHHRHVALAPGRLRVTDRAAGGFGRGVLRWRLAPGDWRLADGRVTNGAVSLAVTANCAIDVTLTKGWESRYYLQRTALPVLEIAFDGPAELITDIRY